MPPGVLVGDSIHIGGEVVSYAGLVVSSSVVTLPTAPAGARVAVCSVETASIRVTDDAATDPVNSTTASVRGTLVDVGGFVVTDSPTRLKLLRATSTDALLSIEWRK